MESVARRKVEPASARVYWLDLPHREPSPELDMAWSSAAQRSSPVPPPQPQAPPQPQMSLRSVCTRCNRLRSLHSGECPSGYSAIAGMREKCAGMLSPRSEMLKGNLRSVLPPFVSDPDAFVNDAPSGWNRIIQQCTRSISNVSAPPRFPMLAPSPSISPLPMTSSSSLPPPSTAQKYCNQQSSPRPSCLQAAMCMMSRAHRTAPSWAMRSCRLGLLRSPLSRQPHMRNLSVASVQGQKSCDLTDVKQPSKSAGSADRSEVPTQVSAERGGDFIQPQQHPETQQENNSSLNFVVESKTKSEGNERNDNTSGAVEYKVNGSGDANHITLSDDATHREEIEEIKLYDLDRILEEMKKNELKADIECAIDKSDEIETTDLVEELTFDERGTSDEECSVGSVRIETPLGKEEEKPSMVFRTEPPDSYIPVMGMTLDENCNIISKVQISKESKVCFELTSNKKTVCSDQEPCSQAESGKGEGSSGLSRSTTSCCSSAVTCSTATATASKTSATSISVTTSSCSTTSPSWPIREDEGGFGSFWGYWSDEGIPRGHPLDCDGADDISELGSSALQGDSMSDVGNAPSFAYVPELSMDPSPPDPSPIEGTSTNQAAGDSASNNTPVAEPSADDSRSATTDTGLRDGRSDGDTCVINKPSNTLMQLCLAHNVDGLHADLSCLSVASSNIVPPTPTPSLASIDPNDPAANDLALLAQAIRNPCVCPRGGHLIFRNRPCLHISIPGLSPENTEPIFMPPALPIPMETHTNNNGPRRGVGRGKGSMPNGVNLRDKSSWSRKRGSGVGGNSLAAAGRGAGGAGCASPRARASASRNTGAAASVKGSVYSGTTTMTSQTGTAGFGGCSAGRRGSTPRPPFTRTTWSHKVRPEEAAATAAQMM